MSGIASVAAAVGELSATFSGRLLQPTDGAYDEARRVHNGLINKRPALIAQRRGVADIVDAIQLARRLKFDVAVRGGGHNVAGRATIDGGVMIDLSQMKGIHVDPKARTARAQGGLTWNEFNRETQLHSLATTGGVVSTTGIGGLTLGGGLGWLMGKHALALDNLLSVDLVLADGRILTANGQLGDFVAEQCELRSNASAAPRRMFPRHASDQVAQLGVESRAADRVGPGLPAPVEPEALAVPDQHRGRLHDDETGPPARPQA